MYKFTMLVFVAAFALSIGVSASELQRLTVRGQILYVGQSADNAFEILRPGDMVSQDVRKVPGGLRVTKNYMVQGQRFTLTMERSASAGRYLVAKITMDKSKAGSGAAPSFSQHFAFPLSKFESSGFYKQMHAEKSSWKLKGGGTNYHFASADPDHPLQQKSIELSGSPLEISRVSVAWHGASTLAPARLTGNKERFLTGLIAAALPSLDPRAVLAYVREQQTKDYEDGSNEMPRKVIQGVPVYAGTVGSTLIVGFGERTQP